MAREVHITVDDHWFIGEDKTFPCAILADGELTAQDISGWALKWLLKRYQGDADVDALLSKTTSSGIVIAGMYNSDPAVNAQRATITVADTDTDTALTPDEIYYHELKRTDAGLETVLIFGRAQLCPTIHRT